MRQFVIEYNDQEIFQQTIGEIAWVRNITIFSKVKNHNGRIQYAQKTINHGWSRNTTSDLYSRDGKSINNFDKHLLLIQ